MSTHVIIASVILTVPVQMTPEQVTREIKASVAFGRPQVSIIYVSDSIGSNPDGSES